MNSDIRRKRRQIEDILRKSPLILQEVIEFLQEKGYIKTTYICIHDEAIDPFDRLNTQLEQGGNMKHIQIEKIIALADYRPELFGKGSIFECGARAPYQTNNWYFSKDDHAVLKKGGEIIGVCGPSGGGPKRTFVKFGIMGDNIPTCPECGGSLLINNDCLCTIEGYPDYFMQADEEGKHF